MRSKGLLWAVVVGVCVFALAPQALSAIIRVKWDSPTSGPGDDWDNAHHTVTAGLSVALSGDEVWVSRGTYVEAITLKEGVALYGGFAGTESERDRRDWATNVATIETNASATVVTLQAGTSPNTRIDGFTIRGGSTGIYSYSSSPTICGNTVTANHLGVFCGSHSAPRIQSNNITGNDSSAVICSSSALILDNHISGNGEGGSGLGTITCIGGSSPTITNNTITGNRANRGGAIFCGPATIAGNIISSNVAGSGGGIFCSGPVTIINNTISANMAGMGGGIYCMSGTITGNRITGNLAWGLRAYGGGIYCTGPVTISNNIVAGNEVLGFDEAYAGGIGCYSCSPVLSNNTIVRNEGCPSSGVWLYKSTSAVSNNIIAFNTIYSSGSTPILRNNCVYNPIWHAYEGLPPGAGDISADPGLVDSANGNYHLAVGSPCIDTGWNGTSGLTAFDMDGEGRIFGGRIDIGADEYWSSDKAVSSARAAADGALIQGADGIVTASLGDIFYLEQPDRVAGIGVSKPGHAVSVGEKAHIAGTVKTNADGERFIDATLAEPTGTGSIAPLGMPNRSIGGGPFGPQQGVWGWVFVTGTGGERNRTWAPVTGLNNIGLLVKTWGRVTEIEAANPPAAPTWFVIDDGSAVNVKCLLPAGVSIDPGWQFVTVTGVSSCENVGEQLHRLPRVRSQTDIIAF